MHRLLPHLLAVLLASAAAADQAGGPPRLTRLFRPMARLAVGVEEISGLAPLPVTDARHRDLLVVSDEGAFRDATGCIEGALFRLRLVFEDADVRAGGVAAIRIHVGSAIPRLDPEWAAGGGQPDLEALAPLPGTADLFLLGGERNPQDATDGGANRLYVIRYPAGGDDRAELLAYLRLPDLADDTINDRLEAVVAVPGGRPGRWAVFAMKERTRSPADVPRYVPAWLERHERPGEPPRFELRPLAPRALIADPERLGAQADACLAPNGAVWVLDRWRREIHLAEPAIQPEPGLRYGESLNYFDAVEGMPGEHARFALPGERRAPGGRHPGFGRQEAIGFDERGRLYLAADLGSGRPSVLTVLAPR